MPNNFTSGKSGQFSDIIRCPVCHHSAFESFGQHAFQCRSCESVYPLFKKIPRLLEPSRLAGLVTDYAGFLKTLDTKTKNRFPPPSDDMEKASVMRGVKGRNYTETRHEVSTVKYSLKRRMEAVSAILKTYGAKENHRLLELGCADGQMGIYLSSLFGCKQVFGLDLQDSDMDNNPFPCFQGDCQNIPFCDESFDILVGAALIEHLPEPEIFLNEAYRVLSSSGILVLTCPDPVWDWICTKTGYFKYANHLHRFSVDRLEDMLHAAGFRNIRGKKFMLAPFESGFIRALETSFARRILSPVMMNQVVSGVKQV